MWRLVVMVVGLAGCIEPKLVRCDDGNACPEGTVCSLMTAPDRCVTPEQVAACSGFVEGATCNFAQRAGWCDHGACVPIVCGNSRVDLGEACDDSNSFSGDGCSADCQSSETCGNGIVDGVNLEQCDDDNLVDHDGCDSQCRPEQPSWQQLWLDRLDYRTGAAMAFDVDHQRAVLYGGGGALGARADTWLWNGLGWVAAGIGPSPGPRAGHAMAYDVGRHRVVLYGGGADTWEWNGLAWSEHPSPNTPGPRDYPSMVYDARRQRVVLFGGSHFSGMVIEYLNDTYEWDGTTWRFVTGLSAPPGRIHAAMAYDPVRGRVVMFGGGDFFGAVAATTYEYDGTDWVAIPTTLAPSARSGAGMAWDATSQTIVLFGGRNAPNDTWTWDGQTWTPQVVTVSPPARTSYCTMVADRDGVLLFGGITETPATTWRWAHGAWTNVTPPAPSPQIQNQVAYDPLRGRAVMVDAVGAATWESDGESWIRASAQTPLPIRSRIAMAFDVARRQTVAFGGVTAATALNDTWTWDGATWTQAAPAMSPSPRVSMLAYDSVRQRVVLFGGGDPSVIPEVPNYDTWEWDGQTWTQLAPAHAPPARYGHVLAYDPVRAQVVLFGGAAGLTLDDTWTWDGVDWTEQHPATIPTVRVNAALVWNPSRDRLAMFGGGGDNFQSVDASWEWDGTDWTFVPVSGPGARSAHAMFPDRAGDGVVMFGGQLDDDGGGAMTLNDTWRLRWDGAGAAASNGESCAIDVDLDGDKLTGCADRDCWYVCTPLCEPGVTSCPAAPGCGDGVCNNALESCRICPGDCGACATVCGDAFCDPSESTASCPGDCL